MNTLLVDISNHNGSDHTQWTVEAFYRAISDNVFDNPKEWEVVDGEVWEKEHLNPPHASLLRLISRLFRASLEPRFLVLPESPLHLSMESEPTPDIYVVNGSEENYLERHPNASEVTLLVEVADTTIHKDTFEKARLYARFGIEDYWVSLIPTRELVVFRTPTVDGYAQIQRFSENDVIRPLCAPDIEFSVRDLIVRAQLSG